MTVGQNSTSPLLTNAGYSHVFLCLGLIAFFAGIMLFIITPIIKRWMNENKPTIVKGGVNFVVV